MSTIEHDIPREDNGGPQEEMPAADVSGARGRFEDRVAIALDHRFMTICDRDAETGEDRAILLDLDNVVGADLKGGVATFTYAPSAGRPPATCPMGAECFQDICGWIQARDLARKLQALAETRSRAALPTPRPGEMIKVIDERDEFGQVVAFREISGPPHPEPQASGVAVYAGPPTPPAETSRARFEPHHSTTLQYRTHNRFGP